MDRRCSWLTKVGLGVLACSSVLAVCNSWGDAGSGSVAFVLVAVADAALLLFFLCLREFERRCRDGGAAAGSGGRIKAAVWALTAMFAYAYASRVAPPLVVGALVFLCLCESEWTQMSLGGGRYAELVKMGLGIVACSSALAHHHDAAAGGSGSLALVFIAYAGFVTRACLFLRRFDGRARRAEQ